MSVDKLLVEAGAYFGGDGVNYDRFEPRKFAALVLATTPPQRTEQEPWCMKMNGCKTKCEDCPDEPPQPEQEPHALQGLAAYLRCEAGGVFVGSPSHDALLQWAREVDAAKAQQEPKQEPVAWRTFDGEGGYDYRSYEDNESYADDWNKRNPNHSGWVDKLYTTPPQRTWVDLTDEDISKISQRLGIDHDDSWTDLKQAIEAKLKQKNGFAEEKNS